MTDELACQRGELSQIVVEECGFNEVAVARRAGETLEFVLSASEGRLWSQTDQLVKPLVNAG